MIDFAGFCSARWPGRPRSADWAKAWADDFEPFSFDACVMAARKWRSEGKVAPDGDDLLAILRGDDGALHERLFAEVLKAVRDLGFYRPPADDSWSHPAIPEAIRSWGGWAGICRDVDLYAPATHAQFRDTLKAVIPTAGKPAQPALTDGMSHVIEAAKLREIPG